CVLEQVDNALVVPAIFRNPFRSQGLGEEHLDIGDIGPLFPFYFVIPLQGELYQLCFTAENSLSQEFVQLIELTFNGRIYIRNEAARRNQRPLDPEGRTAIESS